MKNDIFPFLSALLFTTLLLLPLALASHAPPPQGYINDHADLLTPEDEATLTQLIQQIEQETTAEIAIATVTSLQGDSIEHFTTTLFEEWGVGKTNDNGLLLLIAKDERQYRFETGYGLEAVLNDAKLGRIGREKLAPNFQQSTYAEGIHQALLTINQELQGKEDIIAPQHQPQTPTLFWYLTLAYLILLISLYVRFQRKKQEKHQNTLGIFHLAILAATYFLSTALFILLFAFTILLFLVIILITKTRGALGHGGWHPGWGRGRSGGSTGGFGGFGGGRSGGGGATGRF